MSEIQRPESKMTARIPETQRSERTVLEILPGDELYTYIGTEMSRTIIVDDDKIADMSADETSKNIFRGYLLGLTVDERNKIAKANGFKLE